MKIILTFLLFISAALGGAEAAQAKSADIALTVNEDIISKMDIEERINLIMASSGLPNTPQTRQKIAPQIIDTLILETIQIQEAEKHEIFVTDAQIDKAFAGIAASNNMQPKQFEATLRKNGASVASLRNQLKARLSWSQAFGKSLRRRITITSTDIDNFIDSIQRNIGKQEYLLSEIFLPVDKPSQDKKVKQLAAQVTQDLLQKKAPFVAVAKQLSKSPSAAQGGLIGWIPADQLDSDIAKTIRKMPKSSLSQPLRSTSGYHIYFINDIRTITEQSIPSRDEIRKMLHMRRAERASANHLQNLRNAAYVKNHLGQ